MLNFLGSDELVFLFDLALSLICGIIIGIERELMKKPAGISTQTLVIGASMIFSFISRSFGEDPTRIAAQIVSGVGFLGAGIILRSESSQKVANLTTAASIWYSSAVGMALGFDFHLMAFIATIYAVVVSRIPRVNKRSIDDI